MRYFDYSFLSNDRLPTDFLNMVAGIYSLKTASGIRQVEYEEIFTELEFLAKVQSVKGSNAIEGIITSDERIAEIVAGNVAPLNHDEKEIAGYRDSLHLVHTNYENLDFTERSILDLHAVMLNFTNYEFAGLYKQKDNAIIEISRNGERRIRFQPTSAKDTPKAMEQLCLAYMDARSDANINPLLLIPCVILDFLCIHPFSDGNGRMSRLLTLLLLYRNGFDAGKYISFEEQINLHKIEYYEALRASSIDWHTNTNDYIPFIKNFLLTLYTCYKELDSRFAVIGDKKITKSARIEATVLNSLLPISKSEICKILPDVSPTTVELILGQMLKAGQIKKLGKARATKYLRV